MQALGVRKGSSLGVRKGAWSQFEDELLKDCVQRFGEGKWHLVPQRAGLKRCRKSCRLRWLNYLKPNIKRGEFSEDEVDLMIKLHKLLGNRWSLIAGRLPGRTSNDVKNYWNTNMHNKIHSQKKDKTIMKEVIETMKPNEVIKSQPRTFSKQLLEGNKFIDLDHSCSKDVINEVGATSLGASNWWDTLFEDEKDNNYSWGNGVLQSGFWDTLFEDEKYNNYSWGNGVLQTGFWDEELNSITTNPFDFLNESQIWSEFLSQT